MEETKKRMVNLRIMEAFSKEATIESFLFFLSINFFANTNNSYINISYGSVKNKFLINNL